MHNPINESMLLRKPAKGRNSLTLWKEDTGEGGGVEPSLRDGVQIVQQ